MTPPVATYRLQFRDGMNFDRAAGLAGYLARLGISDVYASPVLAAAPGSTHGYDVTDFGAIDPALGGTEGFARLIAALAGSRLGLLLDFVPNHMAAADCNGWWQGVLEWGAESRYAAFFDIDWQEPKLILPILGTPYIDALQDGVFGLAFEPGPGALMFTCYERRLRLTPPSYALFLARVEDERVAALARRFAAATVETADALRRELAAFAADRGAVRAIEAAVRHCRDDRTLLNDIHEAQPWRLAHWPVGRDSLTYRSFFEIDDLICLRVEDPAVFEAVHGTLLSFVGAGRFSGIRLDHIDGLADPKGYLQRLQQRIGGTEPFYLLVEKILEPGESLRPDWPVAGTTGYEFIAALAGLFVDRRNEAAMDAAYEGFAGPRADYEEAVREAKREILEVNLAADLAVLTARAQMIAAADIRTRDFGTDTLRRAIVEIAAALPVYRTYVTDDGADEADRALVRNAAEAAAESRRVENPAAIGFVADMLVLEGDRSDRAAVVEFATRFQQTTGPVMAKALEDTVFYRENRLIALNEVGGSGDAFGAPLTVFHDAMAERLRTQPAGLSATATHDTKRGEDARARLYVLSEGPELWGAAVTRWHGLNAVHRTEVGGEAAPETGTEWLFYQALAGAWPLGLAPELPREAWAAGLEDLRERMLAYMEKAIREAKLHTSWLNPNAGYEEAVKGFVRAALAPESGRQFLDDFFTTCRPVWLAGAVNGLAQLAVKLAAPGVPDLYQGCELWDFSLVDPDNRTPVDFDARQTMLGELSDADGAVLLDAWQSGAPKMALTAAGLRLRGRAPDLFGEGAYAPLEATGDRARHVAAFARTLGDRAVLAVVPRFVLSLAGDRDRPLVPADRWGDTAIALGTGLSGRRLRDAVTGAEHRAGDRLSVGAVLADFPVALLEDIG